MSDIIRKLLDSRLPSDAVAGLGNFLTGQSVGDLMARQDGQPTEEESPLVKLQKMAAGVRPDPSVSSLQLDR
jgi:hypothetical protein